MSHDYIFLLLISLCAWAYFGYLWNRKSQLPLPPSPKSDPFFGHLRYIPSTDEHIFYRDLGKKLNSDIVSMTVLGQVIIVLNSAEVTTELLTKRSSIYSDRPELPMLNDKRLVGWGEATSFLPYGELWKNKRRLTQSALHKNGNEDVWPKMVNISRISIQRLLDNPDNFASELRWMIGAIIMSSVYGYEAAHPCDSLVGITERAMSRLGEAALPGNFYVNTIRWLIHMPSWLPGAGWKRKANAWRAEKDEMINRPYEWTKAQMTEGNASPSMLKTILTASTNGLIASLSESEEDDIRWITGTLFAAGSDTTVSAIMTFILAMVLHPSVQKKAQAELDIVLGDERLPELSDRDSLPYINCIMKEVSRWLPVAPLAVPHACSQDDEYKGYRIPKGAIVLGNIWAICNDPSIYPNPETFNPNRFLDKSVPDAPAFGFGRRICPGSQFAEAELFIAMSTLLIIFNIRPARDEKGHESIPKVKIGSNSLIARAKCKLLVSAPFLAKLNEHSLDQTSTCYQRSFSLARTRALTSSD